MALKTIVPGATPLASDVQQIIDALRGAADVGVMTPFDPIGAPGAAPLLAAGPAGNLNGAYLYKVTFVTGQVDGDGTVRIQGETAGGPTSGSITVANARVNLSNIPTGPSGTVARRIYRTAAGGADGTQRFVAAINDNATTTLTDNVADAGLGSAVPTANTTGSFFGLTVVAALPPAGSPGRTVLLNTGTLANQCYYDTGSSWAPLAVGLVMMQESGGFLFYSTDGSTWKPAGAPPHIDPVGLIM